MTEGLNNRLGRQQGQFLLIWSLANLLGGFGVGLLENNGLQFAATLLLTGVVVGWLQGSVLHQYRALRLSVSRWTLVSTVGWILGSLVLTASGSLYRPIANALWSQFGLWEVFWLSLFTAGIPTLGMALAQSGLLHRKAQPIGIWLVASGLGGVAQGVVSATLCAAICPVLPQLLVGLVNGLGWWVYGLITGCAWIWGMRWDSPQNPRADQPPLS